MLQSQDGNYAHMPDDHMAVPKYVALCMSVFTDTQFLWSDWNSYGKLKELYVPLTTPHTPISKCFEYISLFCCLHNKYHGIFLSGTGSTAVKNTATFAEAKKFLFFWLENWQQFGNKPDIKGNTAVIFSLCTVCLGYRDATCSFTCLVFPVMKCVWFQ